MRDGDLFTFDDEEITNKMASIIADGVVCRMEECEILMTVAPTDNLIEKVFTECLKLAFKRGLIGVKIEGGEVFLSSFDGYNEEIDCKATLSFNRFDE